MRSLAFLLLLIDVSHSNDKLEQPQSNLAQATREDARYGTVMSKTTIMALAFIGWCCPLLAQEMPAVSLPGNLQTAVWHELNKQALPEFVADTPSWPHAIASSEKGMEYDKVSGSGYATGSGIYSGGSDYTGPLQEKILAGKVGVDDLVVLKSDDFKNVGRFQIVSHSPLSELKTVVFQIRIKGFPPGEHFTPFELTQHVFPVTLSYNQGAQHLPPSSRKLVSIKLSGGFYEEIYALQWNLESATGPIREFAIRWAMYPHGLTTGLRVDQGDVAAPPLVANKESGTAVE